MKSFLITFCLILGLNTLHAETKNGFDLSNALIPSNEILQGGPPKDGIPSIDNPIFVSPTKSNIYHTDRVLGLVHNGQAKAYPINILNWHEIVNEKGSGYVVTFCPLCGTGMAFESTVLGEELTFGVSGLLYNSDVLFYDRESESLWSQLKRQSVNGKYKGSSLKLLPLQHTTWGAWKADHPDTLILSTKTGYHRDYTRNPYDGYEKSRQLYFKVNKTSQAPIHPKEWVIGITYNGMTKAYPFSELNKMASSPLVENFKDEKLLIHWDKKSQSAKVTKETTEEVAVIQAFWFAWFAFNPETKIYSHR